VRPIRGWIIALGATFASPPAHAQDGLVVDRVAVRYVTPETGGVVRPGYLMQRVVALHVRVEAQNANEPLAPNEYPDRWVRSATDRLVARAMLSSLLIQRGIEPPNLPALAQEARAELEARVGGAPALAEMMKRERIDENELDGLLRDQVRAAWYIDRAITPILAVTDDSLREAYRASVHPFRNMKFEDARPRLKRWLVVERQRAAELEFLQSARTRIKITPVQTADTGAAR
jgi:hypothetical protein